MSRATLAAGRRARREPVREAILGWSSRGVGRDGSAPVSQLRFQLHGDLSRAGTARSRVDGVRPLPFNPLVVPSLLTLPTVTVEPRAELILLLRLVVAGLLAAVLGWERQSAHKPAGLRTHMLVGLASALFTVLAELATSEHPASDPSMRSDPIRVIQAVAVGIGFLGSGVIFVSRSGDTVLGLTTAASIWATAAVGIAAGLQHYILAVGATLLMLVVLRGMGRFERDHE